MKNDIYWDRKKDMTYNRPTKILDRRKGKEGEKDRQKKKVI